MSKLFDTGPEMTTTALAPSALCQQCNRYSVLSDGWCRLCSPPHFESDQHRDRWLALQRWNWPDYTLPLTPEARQRREET